MVMRGGRQAWGKPHASPLYLLLPACCELLVPGALVVSWAPSVLQSCSIKSLIISTRVELINCSCIYLLCVSHCVHVCIAICVSC
jgi:hypothetical protein